MLIDTRTPEEFSFGTIPGAVNIPLDEMREHLAEIPTDKPVVLFCAVGLRGYLSLRILIDVYKRQWPMQVSARASSF